MYLALSKTFKKRKNFFFPVFENVICICAYRFAFLFLVVTKGVGK